MGGWQPEKKSKGTSDSTTYQKTSYFHLEDGESVDFRFMMEPIRRWVHKITVNKKQYPASCIESPTKCPAHQKGMKAQRVMAANVLDRRDGKVKLYEFSNKSLEKINSVMDTVKTLRPEFETPLMFDIKISRKGKGKEDTTYSFGLGANMNPITDAEKALTQTDLEQYYAENKERMETLLSGEVPKRKEQESTVTTENPLENQNF